MQPQRGVMQSGTIHSDAGRLHVICARCQLLVGQERWLVDARIASKLLHQLSCRAMPGTVLQASTPNLPTSCKSNAHELIHAQPCSLCK